MKHYYFKPTPARIRPPYVHAFMQVIAGAFPLGDRKDAKVPATIGHPYPPILHFAANLYRLPEVLFAPLSLLVSERGAEVILRHKANVELLPTKFEKAFFLPFEPGTDWHERAIGPNTELFEGVPRKALTRFAAEPPSKTYYEVAMKRTGDLFEPDQSQFTQKSVELGHEYLAGSFDFQISDNWTKKHKLYYSGAYVCNEKLFAELSAMLPALLTYSGYVES